MEEAGVAEDHGPERPLKKRRRLDRDTAIQKSEALASKEQDNVKVEESADDDDEDIAFEDVPLLPPTMQTMELDSDDEDDEEDEGMAFEDVDFTSPLKNSSTEKQAPQDLELNLTAERAATTPTKRAGERKKPLTREERDRRTRIHQVHLVCLLAHVSRRNRWCNDSKVHEYLRPLLTDKMVQLLNPRASLAQFGRTESLKTGLKQVEQMWQTKFEVTERGLRRALWAEEAEHLESVSERFLRIDDNVLMEI